MYTIQGWLVCSVKKRTEKVVKILKKNNREGVKKNRLFRGHVPNPVPNLGIIFGQNKEIFYICQP